MPLDRYEPANKNGIDVLETTYKMDLASGLLSSGRRKPTGHRQTWQGNQKSVAGRVGGGTAGWKIGNGVLIGEQPWGSHPHELSATAYSVGSASPQYHFGGGTVAAGPSQ